MDSIKTSINDTLHLNEQSKVPIGLQKLMQDAFQCRICLCTPIKVIMSKCCKSILGCESCVNEWFNGHDALSKTCPACNTERGYSETLMLKDLDNFLTEVKSVIQTEDERKNCSHQLFSDHMMLHFSSWYGITFAASIE